MKRTFWLPIIALLFLPFTACDSGMDDEEEPQISQDRFEFAVSGAEIDDTVLGESFFFAGTDPETDEQMFMIYFMTEFDEPDSSAEEWTFGVVGRATDRAGTGTYNIISISTFYDNDEGDIDHVLQNDFAFVMSKTTETGITVYESDAGELTITSSSSDRVVGTLEVEATAFVTTLGEEGPSESSVTISGSFNASAARYFDFEGWM